MNPYPAMVNREVDQTVTVKNTSEGDQGNLPEEGVESNAGAWKMTDGDAENHDDGSHGDVVIAKVACKIYQICNNLNTK